MRSKRGVDVEPIFGHIKYNRFFDRLMLVGIDKINVELGLHAIAHNLKKMIIELEKIENGLFNFFFMLYAIIWDVKTQSKIFINN